jgi:hypothetical protein
MIDCDTIAIVILWRGRILVNSEDWRTFGGTLRTRKGIYALHNLVRAEACRLTFERMYLMYCTFVHTLLF